MKKILKLLMWSVGLVAVLLLATVITLASLDPNEYKDWIAEQVRERTGRTLTLDGDIAVTLYPWLGLEGNQISLGNAPGFGDGPFVRVDHVKLRIRLMPLLQNEYEVDTVNIKGAVINLAKDEQGISNWDDLAGEPEEKSDASGLPLAAVALGGVAIENAEVTWRDKQTGARVDISQLNVSIAELTYGEPVELSLGFHALSNKPAVDTEVELQGVITYDTDSRQYGISPLKASALIKGENVPDGETTATLSSNIQVNLDAHTASITGINIAALNTTVTGGFEASRIESPAPSVKTSLSIRGGDLALLFKVAEIEPLASQLSNLKRRDFQVDTTVDADLERGDIDISELSANLLGALITGEVKVRNVQSDTPGYQGKLNAKGPDLPMLMQVMGQLQGGRDAALSVYGKKLAKNPGKAFSLKADFDADLKSGDVSIPTLSVNTLGISATGDLQAGNMQSDKGSVSGNLTIKGSKLSGLLRAFDQGDLGDALETVEFTAKLQGTRAAMRLEPLSLDVILAGENSPNSPVKMSLNAGAELDLETETPALNNFTLAGPDLKLAGDLNAKNILNAPEFNGRIG